MYTMERGKTGLGFAGGSAAVQQVNCLLVFSRTLCGLKLQVGRQVPHLHHQAPKENSDILHLLEKSLHLVIQMGVWHSQGRGEAFIPRRRGGWWRRRPRGLWGSGFWSSWFLRSWI